MIPALINLIVYILILAILLALVWWALQQFALPEPVARIVRVALVVITVLIIVLLLLQLVGTSTDILHLPKVAS